MTQTNLSFSPIHLKAEGIDLPICCINGHVFADMRAVAKAVGLTWSALEQELMTMQGSWQVKTTQGTMLLPASRLVEWLMEPYIQAQSRRIKLTRSQVADMFAYEFPRQVMHLFPDSTDARSHAAKLARAVRTGQAVTDPQLAEGIKKAFLTVRQNRKPVVRTAQVIDARQKGLLRVQDITPELVADIHNVLRNGGFKAVASQFTITQTALNQIICGSFSRPSPELAAAYKQATNPDFGL